MRNSELKATIEGLESITAPLPVRVSFTIAKNLRVLKEAKSLFDLEHDKLVERYASDGRQIKQGDDIKGFSKDYLELSTLDAGIELKKIAYEDIEALELTVKQTDALMYMLEE